MRHLQRRSERSRGIQGGSASGSGLASASPARTTGPALDDDAAIATSCKKKRRVRRLVCRVKLNENGAYALYLFPWRVPYEQTQHATAKKCYPDLWGR